jgi:membrane protein
MNFLSLLKKTYISWDKNDPWAKSAIIAYYALFSLPSLLMITMYIAGIFLGKEAVKGRITEELGALIGGDSAYAIEEMIANVALQENSILTIIFGVVILVFGATGVFFQLQKALNDIWSVRAKLNTFIDSLKRRVISFGLILIIGFLLLISLVLSMLIDGLSSYMANYYFEASSILVSILNFILSEIFIAALFASIFKMLPDIIIPWKTTIIGALITSLLFLIGKYIISFYFTQSNPTSVYGAAGSVVLILLWVYYTCLILFFGAEFTVNWALLKGVKVVPSENATLSYEQEIEELRAYKKKVEEDKKKSNDLASN